MITGVLIAESLRDGGELKQVPLRLVKVWRGTVGQTAAGQPKQWTVLDFEADEHHAKALAESLAGSLSPEGAWYVNYNTAAEAFVVFAGRVFRYPRGDLAGRSRAADHARLIGVPESQLDWED